MGPYYACCGYDLHLERSVVDFFSILIEVLWYCMRLFLLRWGPFVHSLGIVQSNFTRRGPSGEPCRGIRVGSCHFMPKGPLKYNFEIHLQG